MAGEAIRGDTHDARQAQIADCEEVSTCVEGSTTRRRVSRIRVLAASGRQQEGQVLEW